MEDEDSGDKVSCPYCNKGDGCNHLLLFYDVTFAREEGGVVESYDFDEITAKAFARAIKEGKHPDWNDWRIQEVYSQIDDEWAGKMIAAETPELPESLPIDLVFELLDEAGGWEHPGSLYDQSGGFSESAVRVFYAEDPEATFEKAKKNLADRLDEDIDPKPKRRRRKK